MKKNSLIDTSHELLIQPWAHGFRLVDPTSLEQTDDGNSKLLFNIGNLLSLPLGVFFRNVESVIQNSNEPAAATLGFSSINASLGKTAYAVTPKEVADVVTGYDYEVVRQNKMLITEQNFVRLQDKTTIPSICLRFPWYDATSNHIVGLLCFAFKVDPYKTLSIAEALIAEAMTLVVETGLLAPGNSTSENTPLLPGREILNVYLSMSCYHYLQLQN